MTECDKLILKSLSGYMNDVAVNAEFDLQTAEKLLQKAKMHKVMPIVFLKTSENLQAVLPLSAYSSVLREVIVTTSAQIQRNAELVRLCEMLDENNIKYLVFKGAVCRAMYAHPEYRISSDEDFLIAQDDLENAIGLFNQNGYAITEKKADEVKLKSTKTGLLTELHSVLIGGNEAYDDINSELLTQLSCPFIVETQNGTIKTFNPTYGLLALCIHFYNHFVLGGIGIRPILDIVCFVKNYNSEIDFDFCFKILQKLNAEKLIKTVIAVGVKYFDLDYNTEISAELVENFLDDIMDAGAYGTADAARMHSGTVTKKLFKSEKGAVSSIISAVFPKTDDIISAHPELKGESGEIRRYRVRRIAGFLKNKDKYKTISFTQKRKALLRELGL